MSNEKVMVRLMVREIRYVFPQNFKIRDSEQGLICRVVLHSGECSRYYFIIFSVSQIKPAYLNYILELIYRPTLT